MQDLIKRLRDAQYRAYLDGDPDMEGLLGNAATALEQKVQEKNTVIPVETVSAYLQQKLDEWEALGDRKWDPMNAWGYNFLRACQDDLEKYTEGSYET